MSPYMAYGVGLGLLALSVATGGLWWLAGMVLVIVAREKQVKDRNDDALDAERFRARRQIHRMYAD